MYAGLLLLLAGFAQAQRVPTPDVLWGDLFRDVQLTRALGDNKTFVDMVPLYAPDTIIRRYQALSTKDSANLRGFVLTHFQLPAMPPVVVKQSVSLATHLNELWNTLSRREDSVRNWSSLLPLPHPYVVPGGRFREIYYWDSYFTMLGLDVSGRTDLIENMVKNFAYLVNTYGHIPNGNRNYYLSRSQPPFFALMVKLLRDIRGNDVYRHYFPALEKEYSFWMEGQDRLASQKAFGRVVRMPDGSVLNRYWDDNDKPRQESYFEDTHTAKEYSGTQQEAFRNLRAGAESGWDYSSRWFADTLHLVTIETTHIVPVDLNALLYATEHILAQASLAVNDNAKATFYFKQADKRKAAVRKYLWHEGMRYFFDYNFVAGSTTNKWSLAGVMPLFVELATETQARGVEKNIVDKFLRDGGVVTTLYKTGQQWDAPNGWPPLQYVTIKGLMNYGNRSLAATVATRWMKLNEKVFANTGKMMEKYNVENTTLESGGGEYPTQDGFGWTNGVYLKLYQIFNRK